MGFIPLIKKTIGSVVAFFILAASGCCMAQWPRLNGTMMPYDFEAVDSVVPWENDMKPVFINYVARHGARFLSSEKKVTGLRATLEKARQEGNLSEKGEKFLALLDTVNATIAGRWGALNNVGIMEEQRLGQEMTSVAPSLLRHGKVNAIATYVPRVVMTMYELCHELARCYSDIEISTVEGKQFNPLLRYFTVDTAYVSYLENGSWKSVCDSYADRCLPKVPAESMFNDPKKIGDKNLKKISLDAYGVLQSLDAAEIKGDVSLWFTEKEYRACWEVSNLKHYYQRSASRFSSLPARCAAPLLRDMIEKTDSAVAGLGREAAFLRFGHAETVLPLFALMRLPGCYLPDVAPENVANDWKDWEISPLGANLMMVVLESRGGGHYIALRLNGKWVNFGGSKIISWPELRNRWESYLKG